MSKISGGYYIIARAIQESNISEAAPCTRELWVWLIKEANHKDNAKSKLKRGQLRRTIGDMQDGLRWFIGYRKMIYSDKQIRSSLEFLAKDNMIVKTKVARGLVITVCKYDHYQDFSNYEGKDEG